MAPQSNDSVLDKIEEGLKLSFQRLLEKEKARDGYLVIADKDGNIVHVRARDWEKR